MKKLAILLFTLLLAAPVRAAVDTSTPEGMIKGLSDEVLTILKTDPDLKKGDVKSAVAQIDAKVLTHFNFRHMTSLAMGKEWRKATPAQQDTLVKEFKDLLVRTYSNALTVYRNPTIVFKTSRVTPTDADALVRTQVLQPGNTPADIDDHLEKTPAGWQVFDVVVAGVSLVTNYRDYFTQEVSRGGVEGAIASMRNKNETQDKGK